MNLVVLLISLFLSLGLVGFGVIPLQKAIPTPVPTIIPSPTPTPTPRPLTFAEMNSLYGPCAYVPVPFWHHVQNMQKARDEGHAGLTVDTEMFRSQIQYLKDSGYTAIRPEALIAFFDNGTALPPKPVLLTFDDGYDDFASDAAPVLAAAGFPATVFLPTGLVDNPGYLSWGNISGLSGSAYFGNHTWSHRNVNADPGVIEKEIQTADTQLSDHGVNGAKVFAYPYGFSDNDAVRILKQQGYRLAFTTYPGGIQCKGRRLVLPRTRIGSGSLSSYGF